MKYVCELCGWSYDEAEGYPEGDIVPAQNGKTFPKISFAPYVWQTKTNFTRTDKRCAPRPLYFYFNPTKPRQGVDTLRRGIF